MIEVIYGVCIGQDFDSLFREISESCWGTCIYFFIAIAEWAFTSVVVVFPFMVEGIFYFAIDIAYITIFY